MAYVIISVIRDRNILDYAVYSREFAQVEFDQNDIGLALRVDPCFGCTQYFIIRYVLPPLHNDFSKNSSNQRSLTNENRQKKNSYTTFSSKSQNEDVVPSISFIHVDISYRTDIRFPGALAYHSFQECLRSVNFRSSFIEYVGRKRKWTDVRDCVCRCQQLYSNCDISINLPLLVEIHLSPTVECVCLAWCYRVEGLVKKKYILEDTMNWLSTLGGGYSSLGDCFQQFSQKAGQISITQFKISLEMGDPIMAAKCRLFYALSLMQQGNLRACKHIIWREFHFAKRSNVRDQKLIDMCLGMWSKLQYSYAKRNAARRVGQAKKVDPGRKVVLARENKFR